MSKAYRGELNIIERLSQDGPLPSLNRVEQDRRDAMAEIERLRAALTDIIKHMEANGMGAWPVAVKARKAINQQSGRTE